MPRELFTGPAYISLDVNGERLEITPDDQGQTAAVITDTEEFSEQMTQASTAPADKIVSGYRWQLTFALARVYGGDVLDILERAYHGAELITDPDDESRRAVGFYDRAGCPVEKFAIIVKAASCLGPSRNADLWWYVPYGAITTSDSSFNFSNTEQTEVSLMVDAFPPPASLGLPKVIRGDYTLYGLEG